MTPADAARVQHLVDLGRWAQARELLAAGLAGEPDDARPHALMAQTLIGLGDLRGALDHAGEAVRLDPDAEWGHRLAAVALIRLGDAETAMRAATESVRLDPTGWRTHQALALAASQVSSRRTGAADRAAEAAEVAVGLAPGEPGAHFAVGLVAQRRGDRRTAVAAYERALAIAPDHAEALNNLAVVRDRRHLTRSARGFAHALRADPHNAVTRRNVEQLMARFVRRVYFGALIAVAAGVLVSGASAGRVGPATLGVAVLTIAAVTTYATAVFRGVPYGVRITALSSLRQPFVAVTTVLTAAMLTLAVATCLVPDGFALALGLLPFLGLTNLGLAVWSRRRRRTR